MKPVSDTSQLTLTEKHAHIIIRIIIVFLNLFFNYYYSRYLEATYSNTKLVHGCDDSDLSYFSVIQICLSSLQTLLLRYGVISTLKL